MRNALHLLGLMISIHLLSLFFALQWVWLALLVYGLLNPHKRYGAFLMGFISVFIVWILFAFIIDFSNAHILSTKIGNLLGGLSWFLLPIITALIGGIGGGLSVWAGNSIRKLYVEK
jgi:hypothetical protein